MAKKVRKLNLYKIQALLNYINKVHSGKFDDIELCIEHGQTRYRYVYNDVANEILNPEIVISCMISTDFDEFVIDYYNNEFNLNLKNTAETRLIQELCHECGHHFNIEYYKDRDEEYFEQLTELDKYELEGNERRRAYRKIDEEADADAFAADMIKNHLPEMLKILENEEATLC